MKRKKRVLSLLLCIALLIGTMLAGSVLPVSANSADTFALAEDEYFIAPSYKTSSSTIWVYGAIPVLTPDGKPYTETLTWSSDNTELVAFSSSYPGVFYSQADADGTCVITATNEAGESHSCKVTVAFDGERIGGGDFESVGHTTSKWTTNIIKDGKGVVTEEENGNHVLKMEASTSAVYFYSLPAQNSTKYRLSFDVKGTATSSQAIYIAAGSGGGTKTVKPKVDSWTHYSYVFTSKASVSRSQTIALENKESNGYIYFDNITLTAEGTAESITMSDTELKLGIGDTKQLSLVASPEGATLNRPAWTSSNNQVATVDKNGKITVVGAGEAIITATSNSLTATCTVTVADDLLKVIPDSALQHGTITSNAVVGEVEPEDVITVTVTPDTGYVMIPGSLKYVTEDGEEASILNEVIKGTPVFGRESAGNTFQFVMPETTVTITAEFVSAAEQDFAVDTLGLSFHYTLNEKGEKGYDGIRFLTRLQLANTFDHTANTLTVKYNDTDYTLLELGSLLKRKENETELTYDNAVANSENSGKHKMWISKAYTAEDGVFRLVDYTDSYLDFASVMMTGYKDRFYTARGYVRLQDANGNIITLELSEITNSISSVDGKVEFTKTASHTETQTVTPGKTVTYTIELKNHADLPIPVTITDVIPDVAEYADGCDDVYGNQMTWEITLPANKTKTISYTLKAKEDEANLGKAFDSVAKVDGYEVPCNKIYVERTLGSVDQQLMNRAIDAFRQYTNFEGINLLKMIWNVAISRSVSYNDANGNPMTPAQILNFIYTGEGSFGDSEGSGEEAATAAVDFRKAVIPTLFGGTGVTADQTKDFNGTGATIIPADELMAGDTFFVQESESDAEGKIYIYNGKRLFQLGKGVLDVDTEAVFTAMPNAYRYVGLRFSYVIANRKDFVEGRNDTLTEVQQAAVAYAESMILRGDRAQYDAGSTMKPSGRSEYKEFGPESYTSDAWKYTNCAMLTFDSYYFGAGKDCGSNWYTSQIINTAKSQNIYYYEPTGTETEEEKQAQADKFYAALQPADTIVIRRKNNTGHAMLYIGNGIIIHSTGGSYQTADTSGVGTGVEQYEATVRYLNAYDFFDPKCNNSTGAYSYSIFGGQVTKLGIYRPLRNFSGTIPEESRNRIENLKDIAVEKVASKAVGQTINVGETLTYTIKLLNAGDVDKTLDITDAVPAGTTLVSAEGATVNGTALSWQVTVPADEKLELTFTVKVGDAVPNNKITSTATVGGVTVKCSDIFVANTLTTEQQQALINAAESLENSSLRNVELLNEIYTTAFGVDAIFDHTTMSTLHNQIFEKEAEENRFVLLDNTYGAMAAPSLYGGRNFYSTDTGAHGHQSRLAREENLIVGDVLFGRTSSSNGLYLYLGDGICWSLNSNKADTIDVNGRMERFVGYVNCWVILRPSMVTDI